MTNQPPQAQSIWKRNLLATPAAKFIALIVVAVAVGLLVLVIHASNSQGNSDDCGLRQEQAKMQGVTPPSC